MRQFVAAVKSTTGDGIAVSQSNPFIRWILQNIFQVGGSLIPK